MITQLCRAGGLELIRLTNAARIHSSAYIVERSSSHNRHCLRTQVSQLNTSSHYPRYASNCSYTVCHPEQIHSPHYDPRNHRTRPVARRTSLIACYRLAR